MRLPAIGSGSAAVIERTDEPSDGIPDGYVLIVSARHDSSCRSRPGESCNCLPSIVMKRPHSVLEG